MGYSVQALVSCTAQRQHFHFSSNLTHSACAVLEVAATCTSWQQLEDCVACSAAELKDEKDGGLTWME